jgi:hypothetical protein
LSLLLALPLWMGLRLGNGRGLKPKLWLPISPRRCWCLCLSLLLALPLWMGFVRVPGRGLKLKLWMLVSPGRRWCLCLSLNFSHDVVTLGNHMKAKKHIYRHTRGGKNSIKIRTTPTHPQTFDASEHQSICTHIYHNVQKKYEPQ